MQLVIAAITTAPCSSRHGLAVVERDLHGHRSGRFGDRDRRRRRLLDVLLAAGSGVGGRVARGERVGALLVVRAVRVRDPELLHRLLEGVAGAVERHAVLRATWPGEARDDVAEVELDDLRVRRRVGRLVEEVLLTAVRLDELDLLLRAPGHQQVGERLVVHREEAARGAVLGRHVRDRGAVGHGEPDESGPEVLDELPDDAGRAQDLCDREDEIGCGRALGQRAGEPEADHLRDEHGNRLPEERRLGLDPADAPAEHAEPVHHRGVRVGADERVRERLDDAVLLAALDHAGEELEVHLVADARVRRRHLEVVEATLAPAQEGVALAVSLVVAVDVRADREARRELVHLDGVVDDELRRDQRVDLGRVAAAVEHRVAHGGEVDDRGNAGEVLEEDASRPEGDLT